MDANVEMMKSELQSLKEANHPRIVQLMGVHLNPPDYPIFSAGLVMELMEGGSLFSRLHSTTTTGATDTTQLAPLPRSLHTPACWLRIAMDMVEGINYLHR